MPPYRRAITRAVVPMLAVAASIPTAAAAQAASSSDVVPISPLAGGVSTTPVVATSPSTGSAPAGTGAAATDPERLIHVLQRDLTTSGSTSVSVQVRALAAPVSVELRVGSTGRKVADATFEPGQKHTLRGTANRGEKLRLLVTRTDGGLGSNDLPVGSVHRQTFRGALASWYGPGLFGQRTACGQTLTSSIRGVANKSLPCGTKLTVRYRGRTTQAVVIDRGPFAGNREFDLTSATANAIGFHSVGRVEVSI